MFLERHWCKLVKDIRNGRLDPHLPITEEKRARTEVGQKMTSKIFRDRVPVMLLSIRVGLNDT